MTTTRDLGAIYDLAWYDSFAELDEEFRLVARALDRWMVNRSPRSARYALDVGCGPGQLVDELGELGWHSRGFDGSPHALTWAQKRGKGKRIWCADLTEPERTIELYPIVICTEVAEHLPSGQAPTLVQFLVEHATDRIILTAAPPGQGGHDHVNEQPREYWLDLFADHGWIEDVESTRELRARWSKLKRLSFMPANVMVLR